MTDKQKLVYDLALRCAVLQTEQDKDKSRPLMEQLVDNMSGAILLIDAQQELDDNLNELLDLVSKF